VGTRDVDRYEGKDGKDEDEEEEAAAREAWKATRRLPDGSRLILRQRVRGSARAIRAVRNTRVFQMETRLVADAPLYSLNSSYCLSNTILIHCKLTTIPTLLVITIRAK
jgi:hypothetical protein